MELPMRIVLLWLALLIAYRAADAAELYHYVVQTNAFSNVEDAESRARELKAMDIPAYVSSRQQGGKTLYRVRFGPIGDRTLAHDVVKKLNDLGYGVALVEVDGDQRAAVIDSSLTRIGLAKSAGGASSSDTAPAETPRISGGVLPDSPKGSQPVEVPVVHCLTTKHEPVAGSENNPYGRTEDTYLVNNCTFPVKAVGCIAVLQRNTFPASCTAGLNFNIGGLNSQIGRISAGTLPGRYKAKWGMPGFAPVITREAFLLECPAMPPSDPEHRVIKLRNVVRNSDGTWTGKCVSELKSAQIGEQQMWDGTSRAQ
jgi:hypothetical protein